MTVDISTVFFRKIKANDAFIVSETDSVASGGTFNIHLKNPADSGVRLWVAGIVTTSDGSYMSFVHDGFSSAPSGGTTAEIQAMLMDTENVDNNGVADANRNVSFTSNSEHAVGVQGGGGDGASVGGSAKHPTMAIEPDREIVVEVENTSSSTNNYGISIVYFESTT